MDYQSQREKEPMRIAATLTDLKVITLSRTEKHKEHRSPLRGGA